MTSPAPVSPTSVDVGALATFSRPPSASSKPELLEGAADPGILVLVRLDAGGFHEAVRVLVPGAVRKIVPKHGSRGLRLVDDTERQIGLGEPRQRLLDFARRLELRHNDLEAVDRAGEIAPLHVEAADLH